MNPRAPLRHLSLGYFSLVMGMGGLALAWLRAGAVLGETATGVALVLSVLAALLFVVLTVASLLRWQRHPDDLAHDLAHPVRHALAATAPVALMVLTALAANLGWQGPLVQGAWMLGSVVQAWVTLWVLSRWLRPVTEAAGGASLWPAVTPLLFVPVIGNVVAPLGGIPLGHEAWSAAQFGIGLLFWPVVLGLVLVRRMAHGPMPDRLLPSWFITVAPPSIIGAVLLRFEAPALLAVGCWGAALFCLLWAGSVSRRMLAQPFSLTSWALSFPLASFAALTLTLAQLPATRGLLLPALMALALASLVVLALAFATVRGLREGTLLAPEPVASISVASTS